MPQDGNCLGFVGRCLGRKQHEEACVLCFFLFFFMVCLMKKKKCDVCALNLVVINVLVSENKLNKV